MMRPIQRGFHQGRREWGSLKIFEREHAQFRSRRLKQTVQCKEARKFKSYLLHHPDFLVLFKQHKCVALSTAHPQRIISQQFVSDFNLKHVVPGAAVTHYWHYMLQNLVLTARAATQSEHIPAMQSPNKTRTCLYNSTGSDVAWKRRKGKLSNARVGF